jgi:hypothetical protein
MDVAIYFFRCCSIYSDVAVYVFHCCNTYFCDVAVFTFNVALYRFLICFCNVAVELFYALLGQGHGWERRLCWNRGTGHD